MNFAAAVRALTLLLLAAAACAADPIPFEIDSNEAPDRRAWAEHAAARAMAFYPTIVQHLGGPGYMPPQRVRFVLKQNIKVPAATSGATIYLSAAYFEINPGDIGAVVHELCHVVQQYPRYEHVWLVEGLADYVRFYQFESPDRRPRVNPATDKPRDGYRTTAALLDWIMRRHDAVIVGALNDALRRGDFTEAILKQRTGRDLAQLWAEFVAAHPR